ncbi:MAG: PorT family protein [Flavobacteriaceae bacterium]|jgi:hypothetical protein|nr:PorT family protein [Flavobacteriaceae bacterium]
MSEKIKKNIHIGKMKRYLIILVLISGNMVRSQFLENLTYGIKAGGTYSRIGNLSKMIVSEEYYQDYTMKEEVRWGCEAGLFLNYKFPDTRIALQPEILYSMQGGKIKYNDINGLNYQMDFNYNYLTLVSLVKVYPIGGLNLGLGPVLSFNLTPGAIEYESNQEYFNLGRDLETRQILRNTIKGKTDFSLVANLGYEFENGLMFEVRYKIGLTDVIETQVNGYKFVENHNPCNVFTLTVGYAFNFDSRNNFR